MTMSPHCASDMRQTPLLWAQDIINSRPAWPKIAYISLYCCLDWIIMRLMQCLHPEPDPESMSMYRNYTDNQLSL